MPRLRVRLQPVDRLRVGRRDRYGRRRRLRQWHVPYARVRRVLPGWRLAYRRRHRSVVVGAMRAAYAALVLGIVGGFGLATAVLSGVRPPPTVPAALGLDDRPGLDSRRATAVAALTTACMRRLGLDWAAIPEP